jgi:hypothetical protein
MKQAAIGLVKYATPCCEEPYMSTEEETDTI